MSYYCYILRSINPSFTNNTYVGFTTDPKRRIRQHNGELTGGAKATFSKRPHEIYCIISGFKTQHDALSYEWHFKHPSGRKRNPKFNGIKGRILGLNHVLKNKPYDDTLTIYVDDLYKDLLTELPENCIIQKIEEFV
jgi:structure-specific endonuclease subunit SLX1